MPARLPFAFARDHGVILEHGALIVGPHATALGLRKAQRRAVGLPLTVSEQNTAAFDAALSRIHEDAGGSDAASDVSFTLEEAAGAARAVTGGSTMIWRWPGGAGDGSTMTRS